MCPLELRMWRSRISRRFKLWPEVLKVPLSCEIFFLRVYLALEESKDDEVCNELVHTSKVCKNLFDEFSYILICSRVCTLGHVYVFQCASAHNFSDQFYSFSICIISISFICIFPVKN